MSSYKETAINAQYHQALSDKLKAEASLEILLNHPAGIGDHSTTDLHGNLHEAYSKLADAKGRLREIEEHKNNNSGPI